MKQVVLVLFFGLIIGSFALNTTYEEGLYKDAVEFVVECGPKPLSLCFKERALKYVEILPVSDIDLGNGMKLKFNERLSRKHSEIALPEEQTAREAAIDHALFEKVADFFSSHTFEFKMPADTVQQIAEEGRKKKGGGGGGKKGMMPLLLLFYLKAATLFGVALKVIGLAAFKALIIGKVALTIAGIIALKKIVEPKHHTSTYEVVATPQHHFDDWGHYDRAFKQDLAYKAYKP